MPRLFDEGEMQAASPHDFKGIWGKVHSVLAHHWRMGWLLVFVLPIKWGMERDPPFAIVQYIEPSIVQAGHSVTFSMPVNRQLDRTCSVQWQHFLVDSAGLRYTYDDTSHMTPENIADMDVRMGPWLIVSTRIPPGITPGRAKLVTDLVYECNPLHKLWPIRETRSFPFQILPAAP